MQASGSGRTVWAQSRPGVSTVVWLLRAGPRGPGQSPSGLSPTMAPLFPHRAGVARGLASLTTCPRPGWSGRWGPRRVRSAARPSSHHCRASGRSQRPILSQQALEAGALIPCPRGAVPSTLQQRPGLAGPGPQPEVGAGGPGTLQPHGWWPTSRLVPVSPAAFPECCSSRCPWGWGCGPAGPGKGPQRSPHFLVAKGRGEAQWEGPRLCRKLPRSAGGGQRQPASGSSPLCLRALP